MLKELIETFRNNETFEATKLWLLYLTLLKQITGIIAFHSEPRLGNV